MKRIASVLLLLAGTALAAPASAAQFFIPGNLVVSVEGNGSNTGTYGDNQAAPLTLYQYQINGTSSATFAGSLELPQTANGANSAISGEYGSSSEGGLQLTGDGKHLVIMGYGVNAATFNNSAFGAFQNTASDPTMSHALGQSSSIACGVGCTAVPRVVAVIGSNGSVDTTTAITGVFNGNNPRSVTSLDGKTFYISGQGNSPDSTGGVFVTSLGSTTATAITGNDTNGGTSAQDTRIVHIVNGQLVVSVDSKEGSGSNRDFIGTLGAKGALPTGVANGGNGPTQLTGFATSNAGTE
jgi:hypothetical protein